MNFLDEWTIPRELWQMIRPMLRPGMVTLETGSGLSTLLLEAAGCRHTALEHDARFAAPSDCVVVAPLAGDPPWYDWQPSDTDAGYDLILIDGPPGATGGRVGILRIIARLVRPETIVVLDDTHRADEDQLAATLSEQLGLTRVDRAAGPLRRFSILQRSAPCNGQKHRVGCVRDAPTSLTTRFG